MVPIPRDPAALSIPSPQPLVTAPDPERMAASTLRSSRHSHRDRPSGICPDFGHASGYRPETGQSPLSEVRSLPAPWSTPDLDQLDAGLLAAASPKPVEVAFGELVARVEVALDVGLVREIGGPAPSPRLLSAPREPAPRSVRLLPSARRHRGREPLPAFGASRPLRHDPRHRPWPTMDR
jgi:hypothetical protein